jgi:DNA replication protein DnaC
MRGKHPLPVNVPSQAPRHSGRCPPSNKPFGRWGEVFGDVTVAAAMIDRLVHHAEVVSLKGDSYRLKDRDLGRVPSGEAA